jgi:RimJ/RimL family protein N-acetyltransferase
MDRIATDRLILRRARAEDLEAMHRILSNPEAMRYWSSLPHQELEQTRQWLGAMIEEPCALRDDYLVEYRGEVIGKAGCWRLPEIGFILDPACWGLGLAGEALSALIPVLFDRHPIPAITADVDPRNQRSLRLLRRLGFAETGRASGTWQIGEELCDSIYLALPRP